MPNEHVIKYKIVDVKVNGTFEDAARALEGAVEGFMDYQKQHSNYYEPEGRPGAWFQAGFVYMVQAVVLRGPR